MKLRRASLQMLYTHVYMYWQELADVAQQQWKLNMPQLPAGFQQQNGA